MAPATTPSACPLLEAVDLCYSYDSSRRNRPGPLRPQALAGVSLQIEEGQILGILGENGSGKSTLARVLFQIARPASGRVLFQGTDLTRLAGMELQQQRKNMQLVMQDPVGSLNPTWRVTNIVAEPLVGFRVGDRAYRKQRVTELLERVGLPEKTFGQRFPRELSGGQCQRVAVARSLAVNPRLLVLDEAVSTLDALIQAQLVRLFLELRDELGIGIVFISHDLHLVRSISDRVAILREGRLCEIGTTTSVFSNPSHPYTRDFLAAGWH
jgi:oligopeptide transport system ATP-binding protein